MFCQYAAYHIQACHPCEYRSRQMRCILGCGMPIPEIKPEKGIIAIALMLLAMVLVFRTGVSHLSDEGDPMRLKDPFVDELAALHGTLTSGQLVLPKKEDVPVVAIDTYFYVPILVYHSVREPVPGMSAFDRQFEVTPAQFERQMAYLESEGYDAISFDELTAAFSGTFALPERPVIITMDDGRENQFVNAVPILESHGYTATFHVFTNSIDREGYLTSEQIRLLHDRGHEIGSHTVYHPFLTRMSSVDGQDEEIRKSKEVLEAIIEAPVTTFAHPFGLFDDVTVDLVASAGYSSARGLEHRRYHTDESRYSLGAYIVTGNHAAFTAIMTPPES